MDGSAEPPWLEPQFPHDRRPEDPLGGEDHAATSERYLDHIGPQAAEH